MKDTSMDPSRRGALIRQSWAMAITNRNVMARRFYAILFANHPSSRTLFKGDIEQQGQKLVDTLDFIVDHLDDDSTLTPAARDLAIRHVSYGVAAEDYGPVGEALIETLDGVLGVQFTDEMKRAWVETYTALVEDMLGAAYPDMAADAG